MKLATEMPLVSRLNTGDRELFSILEEMDPQMRRKSEEFQLAFITQLLDEAAAPHGWSRAQLLERAKVLAGIFHFSLLLGDPTVLRGLSVARFAEFFADVIVDGVLPADKGGG